MKKLVKFGEPTSAAANKRKRVLDHMDAGDANPKATL